MPAFLGSIVFSALCFIFKKKFDIISFFICASIYAFGFINSVIENVVLHGLLSYNFALSIWVGLIIVASLFYPLFNITGYSLKKENTENIENNY
jgi:hypothetical protein